MYVLMLPVVSYLMRSEVVGPQPTVPRPKREKPSKTWREAGWLLAMGGWDGS